MGHSRCKFCKSLAPYFVSCTIVNWISLFSSPRVVDILFDSLSFLQQNNRLLVFAYVIMENHLFMVVSSPHIGKEVGDFKSYTARRIIDYLREREAGTVLRLLNFYKLKHRYDRNYQLWQEGSHPERIIDDDMLIAKIEHIHNCPVKRRYVEHPEHWLYSSARNYSGLSNFLEIQTLCELFYRPCLRDAERP